MKQDQAREERRRGKPTGGDSSLPTSTTPVTPRTNDIDAELEKERERQRGLKLENDVNKLRYDLQSFSRQKKISNFEHDERHIQKFHKLYFCKDLCFIAVIIFIHSKYVKIICIYDEISQKILMKFLRIVQRRRDASREKAWNRNRRAQISSPRARKGGSL